MYSGIQPEICNIEIKEVVHTISHCLIPNGVIRELGFREHGPQLVVPLTCIVEGMPDILFNV
jgi:hypothetical protein